MVIKLMGLEKPKLSKKQKLKREVEQLKGALDYTNEELQNEIERGNDLCKIIYKLVHGLDPEGKPLEMHEIARITHITSNIERVIRQNR